MIREILLTETELERIFSIYDKDDISCYQHAQRYNFLKEAGIWDNCFCEKRDIWIKIWNQLIKYLRTVKFSAFYYCNDLIYDLFHKVHFMVNLDAFQIYVVYNAFNRGSAKKIVLNHIVSDITDAQSLFHSLDFAWMKKNSTNRFSGKR